MFCHTVIAINIYFGDQTETDANKTIMFEHVMYRDNNIDYVYFNVYICARCIRNTRTYINDYS